MKVIHYSKNKETDITNLVTDIKWSGDSKQVARVLTFGVAATASDKNIPVLQLKLGDMVKLMDGDTERYRGYIFTRNKSLSGNTIEITSFDGLIYLLKSKGTYNFKNKTPGAITRQIGRDFGIPIGRIVNGSPIKRIFNGEEIYNIIMTAYTFESNKTKKQYIPLMNKGKLEVLEKGSKVATYELDPSTSIVDANYSESMESSVNVVKVYDEEGKYQGEVKIDGVPGRLQDVYQGDGGKSAARSLLRGIEKTASLTALGDFDCVTGNAVRVKEEHTGLVGLFFIESDTHTFSNGVHTMELGLAFENLMDKQEAGDDPDDIKKEETKSKTSTPVTVASGGSNKLTKFISSAQSMIGYRYSQANRMGSRSADCSSLVGRAMKMAGITSNAQLTTRSIVSDSRFTKISKAQAKKGDILWEKGHVAIYMGGNRTLEARYSIKQVAYGSLGNRFTHAYRIKGL